MPKVENDLKLRFCIWEYEDITAEMITQELGLIPYK